MLIGCLAYKPQFGVLIPIALLARGWWSTIGAAMASVAGPLAISFITIGGGVWHAFAGSMNFTQPVVLEQGGTGWEKIQSVFSAVRMWGASVHAAYAVQIALALMLAASLHGCGGAMPYSNSRPRRWRAEACSPALTSLTTISSWSQSPSYFSYAMD